MELKKNGVSFQMDDEQVADIVLARLAGTAAPQIISLSPSGAPRIGQPWPSQGGIYAGVMRGRDGAPDYHLIVGPESDEVNWEDARTWASGIRQDGVGDFTLPYRAEQSLQFANVPELFKKEWYWSSEQYPAGSSDACVQHFYYGNQYWLHRSYQYRARAVRRLDIR